jgi:hypothetical protein
MPNIVQPKGFVPSRYRNANPYTGACNMYCVPSSDVTQLNVGDPVKSAAGGDANGIPYMQKAAGTDAVRGVIVGVLASGYNAPSLVGTNLDLTIQNIPAAKTKDYYILVADDPDLIFEVADDGVSALTSAACNKNASFTVTNPTAPGQNSASVLLTSSVAVTQGLNLKIIGLVQKPGNAYGKNALWAVIFNQHEFGGPNTAGV